MSGVAKTPHLFTVADFLRMDEIGLFGPGSRVELMNGEVVEMSPIGTWHAGTVSLLNSLFTSRLGASVIVNVQNPLELDLHGMPQPDLALLAPRRDFYRKAHPQAADVLLLIEIADSSFEYDKSVKGPIYAQAGIREFWIVDVRERALRIFREPDRERREYRSYRTITGAAEIFAPLEFPGLELTLAEMGLADE